MFKEGNHTDKGYAVTTADRISLVDGISFVPYQSVLCMIKFHVFRINLVMMECHVFRINLVYDGVPCFHINVVYYEIYGVSLKIPLFTRMLESIEISHVLMVTISGFAFSRGKWK